MWIPMLNATECSVGRALGWRDARSDTGWLSGIVQEIDAKGQRVRVARVHPTCMEGNLLLRKY